MEELEQIERPESIEPPKPNDPVTDHIEQVESEKFVLFQVFR